MSLCRLTTVHQQVRQHTVPIYVNNYYQKKNDKDNTNEKELPAASALITLKLPSDNQVKKVP